MKRQSRPDSEVEIATSTEGNLLQMGWALHKSMGRQMYFYYLEWLFVYNQTKYSYM